MGLFEYDDIFGNKPNDNERDCIHEECPYKYCKHNKYWNGREQDKLSFSEKNRIANSDKYVKHCMSHWDI